MSENSLGHGERNDKRLSTPEERQRQLAVVRQIAAEAIMAHSVDDDAGVHELAGLDGQLDDRQQQLDQLWDEDPVGMAAFGDDDAWLDKRLGGEQ
jgi:hypothetical protein